MTTVAAVVGWRLESRSDAPERRATSAPAWPCWPACAVLLAVVPAIPGVTDGAATRPPSSVPALAILRDSHRFLGPAVLVLLPGIAASTAWLWATATWAGAVRVARRPARRCGRCSACRRWPGGCAAQLEPVVYPDEWFAVADLLEDARAAAPPSSCPGSGGYRGYDWNERRAMLDPAPRFFAGDVLIDDRILRRRHACSTTRTRGWPTSPRALEAPDPAAALRELGVTRVLVEKDNGVADGEVPAGHGAARRTRG